jgi:hypothetical protein
MHPGSPNVEMDFPVDAIVSGLIFGCPRGETGRACCPLAEVRKLPVHERFQWMRGLSQAERLDLVTRCSCCADLV